MLHQVLSWAVQQVPSLLFLWIRSNPTQRIWICLIAIPIILGFLFATYTVCFAMLYLHVAQQFIAPWDLYNALMISKYAACLCLIVVPLYLLWVSTVFAFRWITRHTIELAQTVTAVSGDFKLLMDCATEKFTGFNLLGRVYLFLDSRRIKLFLSCSIKLQQHTPPMDFAALRANSLRHRRPQDGSILLFPPKLKRVQPLH